MSRRTQRIAELIRQELSIIIAEELKDPRVKLAAISRIEVTPDLMEAKAFVSVIGDEAKQRTAMRGLNHATRFLRGRLGDRIELRRVPLLTFILDEGVNKSVQIGQLLGDLAREREELELSRNEDGDQSPNSDSAEEVDENHVR